MQKISTKKIVLYLALALVVQGCVGAGILKKHTEIVPDPEVPEFPCRVLSPRDLSRTTNTAAYTSAWLEAHWGKPVTVKHTGSGGHDEIWSYRFRPIWEGIMPVVIIPIPIALPFEREAVRFTLRDGRVISATESRRQTVGGAFGFAVGPCGAAFGPFSLEGFLE